MPAADLAPLQSQQTSQHARTGEGELQVQPIQMPHDGEVGGRHWSRQIINAAAADLQNVGLLGDRQIMFTVDHRFALSGRPKILGEVQELARQHAPSAIVELARLALKAKSETARIAAIRELLDRGYGRPRQGNGGLRARGRSA
jgi:hypothetical protein